MKANITFKDADPEEYDVCSMTEFMAVAYCAFNSKVAEAKCAELLDASEDDSDGELYLSTIKAVKRAPTKTDVVKASVRDIKQIIKTIKKDAGIKGLSVRITFENKEFSEKDLASIMKLAK